MRAPETMSFFGVIKPKAIKNDKGRRKGGHKDGKMGQHRLWMAPKFTGHFNPRLFNPRLFNHELFNPETLTETIG